MDATLHALGGILLNAVPTFLLVVFLYFYAQFMFFKPMAKTLRARYEATEGARKSAELSLVRATEKTAEYEAAMRAARSEVYQAQEQLHKQLQERETAALTAARQKAEATVRQAREDLARDVEVAKAALAGQSDVLAGQIADSMLRGSAA